MHKPEFVRENEIHNIPSDFKIQMDYLIQARRPDLKLINKKKRSCQLGDLTIPAEHRVKINEIKVIYKYLDPTEALNRLWNMKVNIILVVICAHGRVPRCQEIKLKDWI